VRIRSVFGPPGDEAAQDLVLLSSLGTDTRIWDPLLPALARSARVHLVDFPGHGAASDIPAPRDLASISKETT